MDSISTEMCCMCEKPLKKDKGLKLKEKGSKDTHICYNGQILLLHKPPLVAQERMTAETILGFFVDTHLLQRPS